MENLKDQIFEPGWQDQAKNSFAALRGKLMKGNADSGDLDSGNNYNQLDDSDDSAGKKRTPGTFYTSGLAAACCNLCPGSSCPKRYLTSVLCSIGFMITFGIRCNAGVAAGYFRSLYNESEHPDGAILPQSHHYQNKFANFTRQVEEKLQWSPTVVGAVESSFFWGYLITQIPGGIIANKFPATRIFGLAVFGSAFLNLFLPTACHVSFVLVIFIRVLQGLIEGSTYPACHGIWRFWAPPLERSRLATLAFCGSYAGAVLGLFLSGLLSDWLGWPAPFYFYGVFGILWFCVWWFNAYEMPSVHPTISEEERLYIESSIGENPTVHLNKKMKIPWTSFFTSMPVYAIIVANFARSWSFYLLITEQTKYFRDVFKYDMTKSGFFSAVPHLIMAIIVPLGGQLADRLRKKLLTTTVVRKIFNCGGFGMEAIFLLAVGYSTDSTTSIVCLIIAVSFSGFAISGYNVNHLDIAPRYASVLMGLSNGIGTFSGMLVPVVTVNLVRDHKQQSWSKVFLIASMIHFFGVIFYAIFASGEQQTWADPPEEADSHWQPPPPPPPPPPPTESTIDDWQQQKNQSQHPPNNGYFGHHGDDGRAAMSTGPQFTTLPTFVQQQPQQEPLLQHHQEKHQSGY